MEAKPQKRRYIFLMTLILVIAAVFLARLIQWQVMQTELYNSIAGDTDTYTITGEAIRGEIFDINGEPLALNLTGYKIVLNKLFINDEELNDIIVRLLEITEQCGEKWIDELPILTGERGSYFFDEEKKEEISEMKSRSNLNMNPYSSAKECMARLVEKYECGDYPVSQQRDIVSVRYNMAQTGFRRSQPYVFAEGISEQAMSVISERMSDISGVTVDASAVRTYKNGSVAPHIIGVTGLISQEEYAELRSKGYSYTDRLGKSGIEAAFEDELRGTAGSRTYESDEQGNVSLVSTVETKPGNSVYLTLDAKLQRTAQEALKDAVQEANDYARETGDESMGGDCTGASVVVLRIKDFSVLCAANYPSYDLSDYYENYEKLAADKNVPLFDRAFMGALAPGSTYKPLVACAALQEKKITTRTTINCDGVYTTGGFRLWCMGFHGDQDLDHALMNSCNVFFAETGRLLGIDSLDRYAKRCGLGVRTGVEVSESAGTLAGPEFSELMGSEWYSGFVSPAAIGQSDNQFTPLQLAAYSATLANNGKRLKTHVVDRIVKYGSDDIIYQSEPEQVDDMGVSETNLKAVQHAMYLAASNYSLLQDYPIMVAGKTGTAENNGSDHANFICYAPFDDPEIAIGVMVEHGAKSFTAIGVAKKIMNEYFDISESE